MLFWLFCVFSLAEMLDYRVDSNQVLFTAAPGTQTRCIAVQIVEDDLIEDSELFSIVFSSPSPFVVLPLSLASVTITDNGELTQCVCVKKGMRGRKEKCSAFRSSLYSSIYLTILPPSSPIQNYSFSSKIIF